MTAEFDLVGRIRSRAAVAGAGRTDVVLGIGDDAALLRTGPGLELAVTMDALNAGVHFFPGIAAADIGWKALAVNLSDLAAMGATPAWCTLALSLPAGLATREWLDGFCDGFFALADAAGIALVGGDTTRGPLSVAVTAAGTVPAGAALRRDRARAGDDVWVTGTLGDAAAALAALGADGTGDVPAALRQRLDRPPARVAAGQRLPGLATACIDLSDGLLADLAHVCRGSQLQAEIELARLPVSAVLQLAVPDAATRWTHQASGGDDYELCFTASPLRRDEVVQALAFADTPVARIGRMVAIDPAAAHHPNVVAFDASGEPWTPLRAGFEHFT